MLPWAHTSVLSLWPYQAEQRILSRVHSLERRLEALAAEFSSNWQKEAIRLERLELRQGAAGHGEGSSLSHEDTLSLLEGLVSRREAALKEDLRRDTAARIQEELATLRTEHHQDSEDLFKKIVQVSQVSGQACSPTLASHPNFICPWFYHGYCWDVEWKGVVSCLL